jgi:exopolysaccharide biosynthesis polyprenyl glycosylphosphotransferase
MTPPVAYGEVADARTTSVRESAPWSERLNTSIGRVGAVLVPVFGVLIIYDPDARDVLTGVIVTIVWLLALQSAQSGPRLSALAVSPRAATGFGTISGLIAVSLIAFWVPGVRLTAPELLVMGAGIFLALTLQAGSRRATARCRIVVVGADDGIRDFAEELSQHPDAPFDVIGHVSDESDERLTALPRLGATGELAAIMQQKKPDLVVLGSEAARAEAVTEILDVASLDIQVVDMHHIHEHAFGKVPVQHLSPAWFMGVLHLYRRPYSRVTKRTFDLLVASAALVVLAPLFAVVSVIAYASRSGPVFFRQLRLGEGGKPFEILKFRTMIEGAEKDGVAVWATEDDPRVTRLGGMLRRTRIDELPQLWNVLRGEMSIVGPRPERPEFLELLHDTVPFWTRRNLVKPGITGWAQVCRGYASDVTGTADKLAYDLYYLKYRSLLFDLAIVSRTVGTVLTGFGSR